jgi:hypothetical protein
MTPRPGNMPGNEMRFMRLRSQAGASSFSLPA